MIVLNSSLTTGIIVFISSLATGATFFFSSLTYYSTSLTIFTFGNSFTVELCFRASFLALSTEIISFFGRSYLIEGTSALNDWEKASANISAPSVVY